MNLPNRSSLNAVMLALGLGTALIVAFSGCEEDLTDPAKALPAPLPKTLPYEFQGKMFRIWGGDYFDTRDGSVIHYVCLQGIDTPKPGQPFSEEARQELIRIAGEKNLRMVIKRLDESKVAFVQAWAPGDSDADQEIDVGLELIKRGFGWYDGNSFEDDAEYRAAEAQAREAKRGLWIQPTPIPPWDFESTR